MPLETFRGPVVATLLAQAQAALGQEAVVLRVDEVRLSDGRRLYELVAGDAATIAAERAGRERRAVAAPADTVPAPAVLAHRRGTGPDIVAVVGPTGAGKTTTVAKLACHPRVFAGRKVGLITLDTYRVGAVEQLRTYAELVNRPFAVVYDAADLPDAVASMGACDVVLVDCPGRGPRTGRDAETVREWLGRIGPHEVHLALPAGLQPALARRTVEQYRSHGITHLLATKLDEYPDDWSIFELAAELRLPMRWVADGQRVPQDLRSAEPRLEAAAAAMRRDRAAAPRRLERTA
jgi:flagellar biosynthesis protein FlhF